MKPLFQALFLLSAVMAMTSCPNSSAPGGGAVGPYDSAGNYVESWADDPSKWKYPAKDLSLAANDAPPSNMTPLDPGGPDILLPSTSRPTPTPRSVSRPPPTPPAASSVVVARNTPTSPPKTTAPAVARNTRTSPPQATKPTVAKNTRSSPPKSTRSAVAKNTRTSKPKVSAPKPVHHKINKGDTLGSLASKYGTSVSAIQRANGMKDTKIFAGKTLTIPGRKK